MARKRMEAAKLTRLEARTRAIQGAGKLALMACCLSLGFVVVATAIPQRRALEVVELLVVDHGDLAAGEFDGFGTVEVGL